MNKIIQKGNCKKFIKHGTLLNTINKIILIYQAMYTQMKLNNITFKKIPILYL